MAVFAKGVFALSGLLPGEGEAVGEGGGDGTVAAEVGHEGLGAFEVVLGEADESERESDFAVGGLDRAGGFERALRWVEFAEAEMAQAEMVGGGLHGVAGGKAALETFDGGPELAAAETDQAEPQPGGGARGVEIHHAEEPAFSGVGPSGAFLGESQTPGGLDRARFESDGAFAQRDALIEVALFPFEQGEIKSGLPGGGVGLHGQPVGRGGGVAVAEPLVSKGEDEQGGEGGRFDQQGLLGAQDRFLVVALV